MPGPQDPEHHRHHEDRTQDRHGLSPVERRILDFERSWQSNRGAKVQAIRERFGVSPTAYYSWRAALIMRPEAMAYAPVTVRQLLRGRVPDGATDRREPEDLNGG
jgi:hypothetical protein